MKYERYFDDVGWALPSKFDKEIQEPQKYFGKIESREYITHYGYYDGFLYLFRRKKITAKIDSGGKGA